MRRKTKNEKRKSEGRAVSPKPLKNAALYSEIRDERLEMRDERLGIRDEGLGIRDEGLGMRDERLGICDERGG
jgi:hypothetical protein